MGLVEHLLAKNVSKPRTVKYINHLIVSARRAGKPLGQLNSKDMEALIRRINTSNYTEHTKHDYKIIIKYIHTFIILLQKVNVAKTILS